jgi:hypothetical protein
MHGNRHTHPLGSPFKPGGSVSSESARRMSRGGCGAFKYGAHVSQSTGTTVNAIDTTVNATDNCKCN